MTESNKYWSVRLRFENGEQEFFDFDREWHAKLVFSLVEKSMCSKDSHNTLTILGTKYDFNPTYIFRSRDIKSVVYYEQDEVK